MSEAAAPRGASPGSAPFAAPKAEVWAAALLTSGTEALLGAVRNYLGPVKTPYDKRELVRRLEAFLRRAETRESLLGLLDQLDARILGASLLVGPMPEQALKDLFLGELPLFELGLRISNLLDRLLLFRYVEGGRRLVAVNPLLEAELRARVMDPVLLFGPGDSPAARTAASSPTAPAEAAVACDAATIVGFFSFLFHAPSALRKGGGLTKRAAERAQALFLDLAAAEGGQSGALEGRLDAMARSLVGSGALRAEGEGWAPDRAAFASLVASWGASLPFLFAALLSIEETSRQAEREAEEDVAERFPYERAVPLARLLMGAFAALPPGFVFSRPALARWLRIAARRSGGGHVDAMGDPAAAVASLEELGLAAAGRGGLLIRPARGEERRRDASRDAGDGTGDGSAGDTPVLVAEGDHAFHLLPEASLEARLLVGCLARPVSFGKVWSFEVDRETARAAFASGIGAASARAGLEALARRPLPQSLGFSLAAWEEEYRSLRLYRGLVLVADERQRPVVERGIASGALVAERLAPGAYFISASGPEEAAAQLARAGLEAPPEVTSIEPSTVAAPDPAPSIGGARSRGRVPVAPLGADPLGRLFAGVEEGRSDGGAERARPEPFDPEPLIARLREALASSGRSPAETRELGDRIERRLVLTPEQIAHSDPRPERLEAAGLDYLGKVRVVERALRSPGDRLEVLYRLPGAEPVRAILRPVRLDKNDKGLVLEAEDLGTGGPARVPLGAVSTVRRMRASLFGEEA